MADNTNQNNDGRNLGSDRQRVAGGQEYEVQYLADKMNCTTEEVEAAINAVGNSRDKVEEYLKKGR
jgi:Protein of unknown function (DUF3606).